MTKSMTNVLAKALPALSGSSITYNSENNVFLTSGYTSAAGNTYYKAVRVSNRLAVSYDIGEAHYGYTFLNGITLYCWDGQKAKVIGQRFWGGCNWKLFSEEFAKEQAIDMLDDYLMSQAKALGAKVNARQMLLCSREMVEETRQKRLC